MPNEDELSLVTLPADIIRMIIQMEKPESIDHLRLISPEWTTLVNELLYSKNQLPVIDFLCLNFEKSGSSSEKIHLKMIIVGRKLKFGGEETIVYYSVIDMDFLRILRRCSKIDTLHLNLPVNSELELKTMELIRAYVRYTPVRLVKVANLFCFNRIVREAFDDLIEFNTVQNFEVELRYINGDELYYFIKTSIHLIHYIQCHDYTHKSSSPLYFKQNNEFWEIFVQNLNKTSTILAIFYPEDDSFHLQIIATKDKQLNSRQEIAKSSKLIREVMEKIKQLMVEQLKLDPFFNLKQVLSQDDVLFNLRQYLIQPLPPLQTKIWKNTNNSVGCQSIFKSTQRIRKEMEKIKLAISQLQEDPSFDVKELLSSDPVLFSLRYYLPYCAQYSGKTKKK